MDVDWAADFLQCAIQESGEGGAFIEMQFKGKVGPQLEWRMVTVRPVSLKGKRHLQVRAARC